jgi:hypothetical protein
MLCRITPARAAAPMLRPWWPHDGCVPEVDDDQLAALRRLRVAFGFVEVVKVVSNDQDDRPGAPDESDQGGRGRWRTRGG